MKNNLHFKIVLICAIFLTRFFPAESREIVRMIKLKMQSPEAVAGILRQTFGRQLRVAEANMVNGVVISSEVDGVMEQAEEVIRNIDRVPSTLRYQIKMIGDEEKDLLLVGINPGEGNRRTGLDIRKIRSSTHGGEIRTIVGLEGEPVAMTTEMSRVDTYATPWGVQDLLRTQVRGLKISGRLLPEEKEAMVDVFYSEGGFDQARRLVTQIRVPVNEWFVVGGVAEDGGGNNNDLQIDGKKRQIGRNSASGKITRSYLVKIEKIR